MLGLAISTVRYLPSQIYCLLQTTIHLSIFLRLWQFLHAFGRSFCPDVVLNDQKRPLNDVNDIVRVGGVLDAPKRGYLRCRKQDNSREIWLFTMCCLLCRNQTIRVKAEAVFKIQIRVDYGSTFTGMT